MPEKIATVVARPMTGISIITKPFIWLLTISNNLLLKIFGLKNQKVKVTEDDNKAIVQEGVTGGEIHEIEYDIVHRTLLLGDLKASELMTHRSDLVILNLEDDLQKVKEEVAAEVHTYYPVINKQTDDFIGVVAVTDLFINETVPQNFHLSLFIKRPYVVHENTPVYKVLEAFRQVNNHYAFVVDEYGTVVGVITMKDIVRALLRDISHTNDEEYKIVSRGENSWIVDGQYPFFEFLHFLELQEEEEADFNTLAGFVLNKLNHIPKVGEKFEWNGYFFEVVDMDGFRIDKIVITKKI